MNLESKKDYYGFRVDDTVFLNTAINCDGEVLDKDSQFKIISFPPKSVKSNKLNISKELFDEKEFGRKYFVYGKNSSGNSVRTYISNIRK